MSSAGNRFDWRQLYGVWQRGELQAYYQASVADDEAIQRGLREGRYVLDETGQDRTGGLNRRI